MSESTESSKSRISLVIISIATLLTAATFGFYYGVSNQNTYLLDGLARIDPDFLAQDWFTRNTHHYHSSFSYLVMFAAKAGDLGINLAMINYLAIVFALLAIYKIIASINPTHRTVVFLMTLLLVVHEKTRSVAMSYIFEPYLQPSTLSGTFTIFALMFFIKNRFLASGLALGVAGFFHTNFLILGFMFFGLAHLLLGKDQLIRRLFLQFTLSLLIFIFQLPFLLEMSLSDNALAAREIFQQIRSPHHYLPYKFLKDFLPIIGWNLLAVAVIYCRGIGAIAGKSFRAIYLSFLSLLSIATLLTTVVHIPFVAQLFFFRMAPFNVLLCQIIVISALMKRLLSTDSNQSDMSNTQVFLTTTGLYMIVTWYLLRYDFSSPKFISAGMIALLIGVLIAWRKLSNKPASENTKSAVYTLVVIFFFAQLITPLNNAYSHSNLLHSQRLTYQTLLYRWAKDTAKDAVFLVPPTMENFRLQSGRSIVVDWKSTPVDPDGVIKWYQRIKDTTNTKTPRSLKQAIIGYRKMDFEHLNFLHSKYEFDYVVFYRAAVPKGIDWKSVYANQRFLVFEKPPLPAMESERESW